MDVVRIGEKIIDSGKVHKKVEQILKLREAGKSQQEVADILGVHRTFISRLEGMGEIRKGKSIALIGFPLKNKEEIEELARHYGIEYIILMTEKERWQFLKNRSGLDLFNSVLGILSELKEFNMIVSLASNKRNQLIQQLVDKEVIAIDIGASPLTEDVNFDVERLEGVLKHITRGEE